MNFFKDKKKLEIQMNALKDFRAVSNEQPKDFLTNKEYFWFICTDTQKYIHKKALDYYYSQTCDQFPQNSEQIFNFYRSMHIGNTFYPKLEEIENFFIMPIYEKAHPMTNLSKNDLVYIKNNFPRNDFTPFCFNSMTFNIVKLPNQEIKIVDIKHINYIPNNLLFCYFSSEDLGINMFYEIDPLTSSQKEYIFKILSRDYDIYNCIYKTLNDLD